MGGRPSRAVVSFHHLFNAASALEALNLASNARAIGEAHRRYTNFVNARGRWSGHLFQSRFSSVPMDENHLLTAIRYVSLNPVRAGLVARAEDWPWSSVPAHLAGEDDALVRVKPALRRVADFRALIRPDPRDAERFARLRALERTGRPLAAANFVADLEKCLGRPIARRSPGRKPKPREQAELL
ncbi:MAG TPA: hypothetical protein VHY79_15795 [Rhizomicrobium sp.]|nr:hypothetical protein [Rhizomicrobium sp.]